jgi:glutaredoxin
MRRELAVYYSPSCAFSTGTVSFLVGRGADFRLVNLDEDPARRARLEKRLGGRKLETPTLEAGSELHVAPSLSQLKKLLEAWGLPAQAAPHQQLKDAEERALPATGGGRRPQQTKAR